MEKVSDIENVLSVYDLGALARRKRQKSEFKTIAKSALEDVLKEGWEVQRENKTSYRVNRAKKKDQLLEDRVWSLFHRMGFPLLSGEGGALLVQRIENSACIFGNMKVNKTLLYLIHFCLAMTLIVCY